VLDKDDRCINVPGLAALAGCPDTDGDGIADIDDKCPNEPEDKDGFEDADGCPDPDNDKDGIVDAEDACPLEPGPRANKGCPDTDRDGDTVVDRLDNCPDQIGPPENNGCPTKQLVTITDDRLEILESVYFKTDRAVIEPRSFGLLDNVAAVLVAHDKLKIQVEGHTDSQGKPAYNKQLSQRRAEAVVAYLTHKGVDAARLIPMGFGEEKPIADNKTKEGRAQNRRVVFTVLGDDGHVQTHQQGAGDDTK
jgi:outer membrane protein OmpA-like peptidoglycan-associated protein